VFIIAVHPARRLGMDMKKSLIISAIIIFIVVVYMNRNQLYKLILPKKYWMHQVEEIQNSIETNEYLSALTRIDFEIYKLEARQDYLTYRYAGESDDDAGKMAKEKLKIKVATAKEMFQSYTQEINDLQNELLKAKEMLAEY
jgi:hypothetical protein